MWNLLLEKPYVIQNKIIYKSNEVLRTLSMDLPVAVVVHLPRSGLGHGEGTDILLYFPQDGQAVIFDYTIGDAGLVKWFRPVRDAFPLVSGETRKCSVKEYKYAVELCPFLILHHAPCPNKIIASFMIDCNSSAGVSGIEIRITYDNDHRENEKVELYWYDGGNESTADFTKIAEWTPQRTEKSLTWHSDQGVPFVSKLFGIRGYFTEEE
jgi:hypothetical protein